MSTVAFHFAGGDAFFSGIALLLLACAVSRWKRTARLLMLFGTLLVGLSATPLPGWFYAAGGVVLLVWLVSSVRKETESRVRLAPLINGTIILLCGIGLAVEIPYRLIARPDEPDRGRFASLVIIGDSLSAGMGEPGERPWPQRLQANGIEVLNLSQMGATARSAVSQAARIDRDETLVLIEIGGNDLLGGTSARQFAVDLERLLETLHRPGRQLIMLELPLPPLYNQYGRIQRRAAARHDVVLVPRRNFAAVLATGGATVDGLHFSSDGHDRMAAMIWRHVGPWLKSAV